MRPVPRSPQRPADDEDGSSTDETPGLPVVVETAPTPRPAAKAQAAFAAQLIAGPQRRGLRGGPSTLENAKSAYLGAEWSGGNDRRTRTGRITKTEI